MIGEWISIKKCFNREGEDIKIQNMMTFKDNGEYLIIKDINIGGRKPDTGTVSGLVGFGKALSFEEGQVYQFDGC